MRSRQALLEALIGFASTTGAAICAEGVEDLDDLHALVSLDVTYAQGYGLARPGPAWPVAGAGGDPRGRGRDPRRPAHRDRPARRGRAPLASGIAELSDDLAAATKISDLGAAHVRAAELLGRRRRLADAGRPRDRRARPARPINITNELGTRWSLADFPATRYVLDHRVPGQVVAGDEAGDPAELAELADLGFGTVVIVPVVFGGRELAVLEVYRVRPQAFTAREVDRARVLAQQFGAALDRLT